MVRVTVKDSKNYSDIAFTFPNMEAATKFIDIVVDSAVNPVSFQIEKKDKMNPAIMKELFKPAENVELYKLCGSRFINPEEGEKK